MGADYKNTKIFIGKANHQDTAKQKLIEQLDTKLRAEEFVEVELEDESNWSYILINDRAGWLHFGEMGKTNDIDEFPTYISKFYPTIRIRVSDDAAVKFTLFENDKIVDRYANMDFPFFSFESREKANEYKADFVKWEKFLAEGKCLEDLKEIWKYPSTKGISTERLRCNQLMKKSNEIFDWDVRLACIGYTYDIEGMAASGLEYLKYGVGEENYNQYKITQRHYKYIGTKEEYIKVVEMYDY